MANTPAAEQDTWLVSIPAGVDGVPMVRIKWLRAKVAELAAANPRTPPYALVVHAIIDTIMRVQGFTPEELVEWKKDVLSLYCTMRADALEAELKAQDSKPSQQRLEELARMIERDAAKPTNPTKEAETNL